jgi:hypothetical protein
MESYGRLNAHSIGIIMKEMVRRALEIIWDQRFCFQVTAKRGLDGKMDDIHTTADEDAQKMYVKLLQENFPTFGIIAEEGRLRIPCTDTTLGDIYFTVDALDGTKAYNRRQSHGIGTMISLVHNGEVIAAYVGDVMTQEIYGYRPESDKVYRISGFGKAMQLAIPTDGDIRDLFLILRKRPEDFTLPLLRSLVAMPREGGAFKDIEIANGSIGICMARLWKGEVGAALIGFNYGTPWDDTPVIGISKKLGFVFMEPNEQQTRFVVTHPVPIEEVATHGNFQLVIHESLLPQIEAWQEKLPK